MGHFGLTNTQLFSATRSLGLGDPLDALKVFYTEGHTPSQGRDDSHLTQVPLTGAQLVRSVFSSHQNKFLQYLRLVSSRASPLRGARRILANNSA